MSNEKRLESRHASLANSLSFSNAPKQENLNPPLTQYSALDLEKINKSVKQRINPYSEGIPYSSAAALEKEKYLKDYKKYHDIDI